LKDCIGCNDCFLCSGLRNARYYFENKKLTKEEYEKKMSEIDLGSYKQYQFYKSKLPEISKDHVYKYYHGNNLQNCTGDYLNHCKDLKYSFDCEDVETGKYNYQMVLGGKTIYDTYQFGTNLQVSYECIVCGENGYHILFSYNSQMSSSDLMYCYYMEGCKNCFGCANMKSAKYCIFNKQYTQEEYEILVPKIIEHMTKTCEWGENFPSKISLHGYNKSSAQLYFHLTKDDAVSQNFKWDEYETPPPQVAKSILAKDLPDNIKEVTDKILDSVIECEVTKKLFKITSLELKFYREQGLPLPRRAFVQRHMDRFKLRNPRKFWNRKCDNCQKALVSTYSPERPEKVFCEECYLKALY
jgi:uncharacterized protein Usg